MHLTDEHKKCILTLKFVSSLLKACVLVNGGDIILPADQIKRAEENFDCKLPRLSGSEQGFRVSLRETGKDEVPKLDLPPDIWIP